MSADAAATRLVEAYVRDQAGKVDPGGDVASNEELEAEAWDLISQTLCHCRTHAWSARHAGRAARRSDLPDTLRATHEM